MRHDPYEVVVLSALTDRGASTPVELVSSAAEDDFELSASQVANILVKLRNKGYVARYHSDRYI